MTENSYIYSCYTFYPVILEIDQWKMKMKKKSSLQSTKNNLFETAEDDSFLGVNLRIVCIVTVKVLYQTAWSQFQGALRFWSWLDWTGMLWLVKKTLLKSKKNSVSSTTLMNTDMIKILDASWSKVNKTEVPTVKKFVIELWTEHWSWESKLTLTFKAVKTLKHAPRSVKLNKFLAFLQFFFQANYRLVLTSAVQKYLKLFVNIRKSFSCFILSTCAWGADYIKIKAQACS